MSEEKVTLVNHRPYAFTINAPNERPIVIRAAVGGKPVEKSVPLEVFEWLKTETSTFQSGSLKFKAANKAEEKVLKEDMINIEDYENNSITHAEIKTLLKGNVPTIKKRLEAITDSFAKKTILAFVNDEKNEVSYNKVKAVCDWVGVSTEILGE